jgi:peptide/nickel transport system substrate-binding protein
MIATSSTRIRRTTVALAALVGSIAVLAAACGGGSSTTGADGAPTGTPKLNEKGAALEPDDPPTPGGRLVVAVPGETNGWNPYVDQWADAGSLEGSAMFDPLFIFNDDGTTTPWLVDHATPNSDYTAWDITLKPNIKFSNGQPLDGKALKETLDAMYQTGLTSVAWKSLVSHVDESGPLSAKMYLNEKWAQLPAALTSAWAMAPEMLERPDHGVVNPIGTGPFVFQSWTQNKSLVAKKNPYYWRKDSRGNQLPYLDEIEFRPIVEDDSRESALQAGDVDMALSTSAKIVSHLQDDFTVLKDYTSERTFVMLNTATSDANAGNPFGNVHARRALAYATDREQIAGLVGDDVQITTQGYRPDSPWGLPEDQDHYPAYDPEKAKAEIEAYKKDTGQQTLSFTLSGLSSVEDSQMMQNLQAQWKAVGIDAKVENLEQVKYISISALGDYQAAWFRWYGWPNPDNNYYYNAKEDSNPNGQLSINFTHYSSPTMQQNLLLDRENEDFATRKKGNDGVITEVNDQAINIWLFDTPYSIIANKKVRGLNSFRQHAFGNFVAKPWWGEVWRQS